MEVEINYLAVLASTVGSVVLGFVWFGPLFGKQWMRSMGMHMPGEITKSMRNSMMRSYALVTVGALVMATVLAHALFYVTEFTDIYGIGTGITTALWVWLGFVATPLVGSVLWEGRPWKYWFIIAGYWLVTLCMMGAVLELWR